MWRDGENQHVPVGGTGVVSCRGITEEQGLEAEAKKLPIGFRLKPILRPALEAEAARADEWITRLGRDELERRGAIREAEIVAELATWGECAWTARDCFVVAG